ncbi:binding-protein-dependent transport systems inner membrane component [Pirellula staleyi DSM 6068]|uniref:Binding-protein-dependent transport systems inner membrane component n=1 Tax=Pirellula staleyi (strain ATCC 27377 / DSM 6068 / ICPB 4128) TaxID=530564 RepID=D2R0L3_PIRSD|nr:ABC transporter permease [Pirellula staleyi]ADB16611.1 binding-protein-dependent transport systems inner membrane component [Pirellula staleyi DSM 6068]
MKGERDTLVLLARRLCQLAMVVVLLAMYAPVVMTIVYSFNDSRFGSVFTRFSLAGYQRLFEESELWIALRTSVLLGAAVSSLSVVFGSLAAWGLKKWKPTSQQAASGLLALPLVTPDMITGISLALAFQAIALDRGYFTLLLAHGVFGIGYAFVVMQSAIADFDENLYAAAIDLGATPWQATRRVIIPLLLPSLAVAWLLVFAISLDDVLITLLTKGVGTDTLPMEIFSRMRFGLRSDTNALFTVMLLVVFFVALGASRMFRGKLVGETR